MRASAASKHLSGAERLVPQDRIDRTVQELVRRAMEKELSPDQVAVSIDALGDTPVRAIPSLDLTALTVCGLAECRKIASGLLSDLGISALAIAAAIAALEGGASPAGRNMRGAMLLDASTGERLEPDHARGVRVSRFDWSDEASTMIDKELAGLGLTHFRTREALALATKVAHGPGIVAELCWSDDPDYTAGYVASRTIGYVRLPHMKPPGNGLGGRAFFVGNGVFDCNALMAYLQETPVLISTPGTCRTSDNPFMPTPPG